MEALEVVLAEEGAVFGLPAAGHALAEVDPEVVASPLVPRYPPARCHRLSFSAALPILLFPLAFSPKSPLRSGLGRQKRERGL